MSEEIQTTEEIEPPKPQFASDDLFLEERRKTIQDYRDQQMKNIFEYPSILPENQNT